MIMPWRQVGDRRGIVRLTLNLNFALRPFYLRGRTPTKRWERSLAPGGNRTPDRPARNEVTTPTTIFPPPYDFYISDIIIIITIIICLLSNLSTGPTAVRKFFSGTPVVSIQKFSSAPSVTTNTDNYDIKVVIGKTMRTSRAGW